MDADSDDFDLDFPTPPKPKGIEFDDIPLRVVLDTTEGRCLLKIEGPHETSVELRWVGGSDSEIMLGNLVDELPMVVVKAMAEANRKRREWTGR